VDASAAYDNLDLPDARTVEEWGRLFAVERLHVLVIRESAGGDSGCEEGRMIYPSASELSAIE
jgi:hypothetical protein